MIAATRRLDHIHAAFVAYPLPPQTAGEPPMRLLFGLILGIAITIGGAYLIDSMAGAGGRMVNWDVVAKNIDSVVAIARDGWRKIAG